MKKYLLIAVLGAIVSCKAPAPKETIIKSTEPKYVLTLIKDKYNSQKGALETYNEPDTITAANDTVAYLTALKKYYDAKIDERDKMPLDHIQSFTITDKNGINLSAKLPLNIVKDINNQVQNMPRVSKYMNDVMQDSL